MYAQKYSERVKGLAPISTVVSGKLSIEAYGKEQVDKWKETGWKIKESTSKPGVIKKLRWSHVEDKLKYNLLENVDKLTMPVLFIVGENDETTPPEHQQILYDKVPGKKEFHIIKNAEHTFREKEHLKEIKDIFLNWIYKYL